MGLIGKRRGRFPACLILFVSVVIGSPPIAPAAAAQLPSEHVLANINHIRMEARERARSGDPAGALRLLDQQLQRPDLVPAEHLFFSIDKFIITREFVGDAEAQAVAQAFESDPRTTDQAGRAFDEETAVQHLSRNQAPLRPIFEDLSETDRREYVARARLGLYAPIGRVRTAQNHGTGFLVAPCYGLTSAHVVQNARTLTFDIGSGQAQGFTERIGAEVVAIGADASASVDGRDWALFRLQRCAGDDYGFYRLRGAPAGFRSAGSLRLAGYPSDRDDRLGLTVSPPCSVTSIGRDTLETNCVAMPGNSGGPLIHVDASGGGHVIALATAFGPRNLSTAGWRQGRLVMTPVFFVVQELMQSDPGLARELDYRDR